MTDPAALERWREARRHACRIAVEAWQAVRAIYHGEYEVFDKPDGPATEADRLADRLIAERLQAIYPTAQYGYMTEESEDDPVRLERERVWIIDPIDGTREFIAHSGNFTIHIALVERVGADTVPVATAVYWPVRGWMFSAVRGEGAWRVPLGEESMEPGPAEVPPESAAGALRLRVSDRDSLGRFRSPMSKVNRTSRLRRLVDQLDLEDTWRVGSMGVKLCQMAQGDAELYINLARGRSKEWDSAAPHLILEEAGGHFTDLEGHPVTYNQHDLTHSHGLLATNGRLHGELLQRVRQFLDEEEVRA